jgi:hypothetical protein
MNNEINAVSTASVPALAIVSTMVGITFWPFALTAVFSVCALVYQEQMPIRKSFLNVIASTAIGGMVSQLSAIPVLLVVIKYLPFLTEWARTAEKPMVALIAIVIGLVAHVLMPALLKRIASLGAN